MTAPGYKPSQSQQEKSREWRKNNPDKVKEYKRIYALKHPAEVKQTARKKYLKTRDVTLAKQKAQRLENPEKYLERQRARRAANPEMFREYQREHKRKNRASHAWSSTKKSAKQKGLAFDLDKEWFSARLEAGICEMSGLTFDLKEDIGVGGRGPNAPSVDRIDPKGPYTKDNCRMILWWLNRALINLGDEYALSVFRAVFVKRGEISIPEQQRAA